MTKAARTTPARRRGSSKPVPRPMKLEPLRTSTPRLDLDGMGG